MELSRFGTSQDRIQVASASQYRLATGPGVAGQCGRARRCAGEMTMVPMSVLLAAAEEYHHHRAQ
jgi:hypothetical protein